MSDTLEKGDKLGEVLFQVQDDLRQLKCSLEKITVNDGGKTVNIQALDTAIRNTETTIRKHAEDYLKTVTEQLVVLPSIEDLDRHTAQVPKWKPSLESLPLPDVRPQMEDPVETSSWEKHKSALSTRLLYNPTHPNNRAIMHQKFGISLPDIRKRGPSAVKHHRMMTGPAVISQAIEQNSQHEEDIEAVHNRCLLRRLIQYKPVSLHPRNDSLPVGSRCRCHKQVRFEPESGSDCDRVSEEYAAHLSTTAPPPNTALRSVAYGSMSSGSESQTSKSTVNLSVCDGVYTSKYPFTIVKGWIDCTDADFCRFRQTFSLCWSDVLDALDTLGRLLRDFAVPVAVVSGELLVEFVHGLDVGLRHSRAAISLLSVLENQEEVLCLVLRPGQRYRGEGGVEAAATHIQACWRRHAARTAYLLHCRRKWAAGTIALTWLMNTQIRRVRKALQARRFRQLENYRRRAQHLAANWKHIQSTRRTIIHIPSLGYFQSQRQNLRGFGVLQNIQISRLCDIRDDNVDVIYICPRHLGEDVLQFYTSLLQGDSHSDDTGRRRFVILTPEAVDYFPNHNMCLSTLLKHSPRTLKRVRDLIQGKQAYIVGGVAHVDDLAVADELGVPILAPEPGIAQLYGTKSGGRRIFAGADVDVPPGQGDIYSLNQLHETLAELMAQNRDVQRWLFKLDSEHGGRGTAYCDVRHLGCYTWAMQQYLHYGPVLSKTKWFQESMVLRYLDEIPEWLGCYARLAKPSYYPTWACFLKTFLRQGGVVEAYPPSDGTITCVTVDLLLEPGGGVSVLSCGDQLHGACPLEAIGCTVPQSSVHPETLHSICTRVGQACLQRLVVGYVSVDLATFVDSSTQEQKVWAIDLDLTYSEQLAMTQMLLMMTGGTLNCRTGCLEVPMPIKKDQQNASKPPVVSRFAVLGIHLFHSNLSMLYHNVFVKMCKAHGMGFNTKMKKGTVFALYDSSDRCNIGMIAVSEDLRGALVTFARNLSVILQDISACKTQGETNFKVLIKEIEDIMQLTVQNRMQAVEEKPAE